MIRSLMLSLLPCLAIALFSGCLSGCGGDDQPDRAVAPDSSTLNNRAWALTQDRWAELIEKIKARIPEAELGSKKKSGGKRVLTVKITDEGYPVESPVFDRPDYPEKVALATIKLSIHEKINEKDSRDFEYVITYLWNQKRWNFFQGTEVLTKSTLPDTSKSNKRVGLVRNLKKADDDDNLTWLFGPLMSSDMKASLGLSKNPPSSKKP